MTVQVALLRAVNVGGQGKVAMGDLRALCERLGFTDVRTVVQTGNLVFRTDEQGGPALERRLEKELAEQLGLRSDVLVRTADEWLQMLEHNPFPAVARADPSHLVMMCLKEAPTESSLAALRAAVKGREEIQAWKAQLYVTYPDGIGRSKLTGTLIESKLGTRGTARNWNTVLKCGDRVLDVTRTSLSGTVP
jgi:uncharacterized protein (DUF1697 family)